MFTSPALSGLPQGTDPVNTDCMHVLGNLVAVQSRLVVLAPYPIVCVCVHV